MKNKLPVTYRATVLVQALVFALLWTVAAIVPFVLIPLLLVHFS